MASPGGMIPEQVWDADLIPERRLYPVGRSSGWPIWRDTGSLTYSSCAQASGIAEPLGPPG